MREGSGSLWRRRGRKEQEEQEEQEDAEMMCSHDEPANKRGKTSTRVFPVHSCFERQHAGERPCRIDSAHGQPPHHPLALHFDFPSRSHQERGHRTCVLTTEAMNEMIPLLSHCCFAKLLVAGSVRHHDRLVKSRNSL